MAAPAAAPAAAELMLPGSKAFQKRHQADQQLISNWAADYFTRSELQYISGVLGTPPNNIAFDADDYDAFEPFFGAQSVGVPAPAGGADEVAKIMAFFKAVITLDRILFHMRVLDSIIAGVNSANLDSSLQTLEQALPQPDWVPVGFKKRVQNYQTYRVDKGAGVQANTPLLYLLHFPVVHAIIALSQGAYLDTPFRRTSLFACGTGDNTYKVLAELNIGAANDNGYGAAALDEPVNAQIAGGGVIGDGQVADGTVQRALSASLKRSGGLVAIYALFNKLLKNYESLLSKSGGAVNLRAAGFISNLGLGTNYGSALQCPPGMSPVYVKHNGEAVEDIRQALYNVNGKWLVNQSVVDVNKSGCRPAVSPFGASARRRKTSRPCRAMKVPFAAMPFPRGLAAARRTMRAVAVPPAMFEARRRRRRTTVTRRRPLRTRLAPWTQMGMAEFDKPAMSEADLKKQYAGTSGTSTAPLAKEIKSAAKAEVAQTKAAVAARRRRRRPMRAELISPAMAAAARLAALRVNIAQARRRRRKPVAAKKRRAPAMRRRAVYFA